MYADIVQLVIMLGIISVAVERTIEIIKASMNLDDKLAASRHKKLVYFSMSTVIGGLVYLINPDQHIAFVTDYFSVWTAPVIVGLASSAGSGVWHEVLKIISGMSVKA